MAEETKIGSRDTKSKPPRHYFYSEGLIEYFSVEGGLTAESNMIVAIDELVDSLRDDKTKKAIDSCKDIIECLAAEYSSTDTKKHLLSDVSYVTELGALKYGHSNYRKGLKFSCCISSFMGHYLKHATGVKDNTEYGPDGQVLLTADNLLFCAANILILLGYLNNTEIINKCNDIPDMFNKEPLYK